MEPENNPTPDASPQPETPNTEPQPAPETPAPEASPSPAETAPAAPTADPSGWSGGFGMFKQAAKATKINLWVILFFIVLTILFSGADKKKGALLVLIGFLVTVWTRLALTSLYLASVHGQKQTLGDAAKAGMTHYVDGFIATIVTAVILILSLLALIVPFFFVLPRLAFVQYYIVDKGMGPIEAIKASWADSKGNSAKVWGVVGVNIVFGVLCLLIVGFYLLFMYQTAFALLYQYLGSKKGVAPSQPVSAPEAVA